MFYSQCFLSSKGPLGAIWIAGYFFKRLKKRQITDTDISSSVDKILHDGLPSVTYRILAYLLLGVVRIYSKKVEYLFKDCHETVSDVNRFSVGKVVTPFRDIVRSTHSISLPEKYELDSFQLEVAVSAGRGNTALNKDISLQADAEKDVFPLHSLDKQHFEEVFTFSEDLYNAQTSDVFITQQATCSSIQTPDKTAATSTFAHTPPDIVLSPQHMEVDAEVSSPNHKNNFETSREKLRESRFTPEDMDVDRICELDVELINLVNDYQEHLTNKRNENCLMKESLENEYDLANVKEVPPSTEKTHDLEVSDARAAAIPEFIVVPTPTKENIQRPRKRKCVFDAITVLDNVIMKQTIKDASGLVCKRRKVPHTVIDLWRFHRIPSLSKIFVEPLIPCISLEMEYTFCEKKTKSTEPSTEPCTSQAVEPVQTTQAPEKQQDAVTPTAPGDSSRSTIAPGTPVQRPTSARVFRSAGTADSDGEGVQFFHAHDNVKDVLSVHEDESSVPNLMAESWSEAPTIEESCRRLVAANMRLMDMNQKQETAQGFNFIFYKDIGRLFTMDATEGDSQEVHANKNGGLSARSRIVARYFRRVMHRKRQQGVETVTLLPIVERKTKRENAMLFFELLVLSSGGLINVVQEKAYGDVHLQETPQLEELLKKW